MILEEAGMGGRWMSTMIRMSVLWLRMDLGWVYAWREAKFVPWDSVWEPSHWIMGYDDCNQGRDCARISRHRNISGSSGQKRLIPFAEEHRPVQ